MLSLLTSVAFAGKTDPSDKYLDSEFGTVTSGVIKALRDCPAGTDAFFKNVNPFISGGPGGNPGELQWDETFLVDGSDVMLTVYWRDDNSFRFNVDGGVAYAIGAEVDSDKLIYEYGGSAVFADSGLNVLESGADSAAVNHLDLCLSLVDATAPVIEFVAPLDGGTVSGAITVIVTATDESGVDPNLVTFSVNDGTPDPMECELLSGNQYQCTYDWDTEDLPAGLYEITVSATDTAGPVANTATVIIEVEVVKNLTNCFGILGDEDFPDGLGTDPYANGCNPTGQVNVQAAPDTSVCNVDDPPDFCFISGGKFTPDPDEIADLGCDACTAGYCGDGGLPDPRMICTTAAFDQDGNCTGDWTPKMPLEPLVIKDVALGDPPGVLGEYVYGYKGCFAAAQHVRGGELVDLYPTWPADPATGLVWIKTHALAGVIPADLIAECNVGQADASQAGYQPIGKTQSVDTTANGIQAIALAATQKCVNPPRTLSRDNGVDVSNIIETDGSGDPVAFKYQMAQMQFDALFVALECAEPTFLRRGKSRFSDVSSPANQAKAQFDNGTIAALERARDDLIDAALAIRTSNWEVTAENCAGDALARTENLAWRMTDLIAAQPQ